MFCKLCPRQCNIDRSKAKGFCGVSDTPKLAKAYLHMWEEPCISVKNGSGTIFFSGCNLRCEYCQNFEISSLGVGKEVSVQNLADVFKRLEEAGADNINLVSPSHYTMAIKEALDLYRPNIPIIYNSNGYDSLEQLKVLKDYIDVYLVDIKYASAELSDRLSHAIDYPEISKKAVLKMKEYQPNNIYDGDKLIKGVIIRHLILPNHTDDSVNVLKWIKENVKDPCISLMGQYVPMYNANKFSDISRRLKPIEYKIVSKVMMDLGLTDGYFQELSSAESSYTPVWDLEGVQTIKNK